MMKHIRIYYFSGAGHSFAVARDLAGLWNGAELINIVPLLHESDLRDEADLIGFVFPVYGGMPPKFITEWISRFKPGISSILFAVSTCGFAPGHSLVRVDKILRDQGSRLTWGFSVRQPQAGIGSKRLNTPEATEALLTEQKTKVKVIARYIAGNQAAHLEKSGRLSEFFNKSTLKVLPTIGKLLGHLITKGIKNMKFHAGNDCDGCGICARLCPAGNITLKENRPVWGDDCLGCMGCYHWCPEDAVSSVDLDMIQSTHPEVKLSEVLEYSHK